ncbi:hypothetical protein FRC02_010412 [Tulasnella sp. 418]|nr:hypothetical protein FRC02_010412 [Tulasnella sp. 418]
MAEDEVDWDDEVRDDDVVSLDGGLGEDEAAIGYSLPPINDGNGTSVEMAFEALDENDYIQSYSLVQEALKQGISSSVIKAKALNLRGTFRSQAGDLEGGKEGSARIRRSCTDGHSNMGETC